MSKNSMDSILRCMICGRETSHVAAGLNYGFPKCCNQTMRVITAAERQQEREFFEAQEQEENYLRSAL